MISPAEEHCIIDEIGRIADDPAMHDHTIGVTTLLGHEQVRALEEGISQVLGVETMLRHDIRVDEPTAFQGDERGITFVSLVADRDNTTLSAIARVGQIAPQPDRSFPRALLRRGHADRGPPRALQTAVRAGRDRLYLALPPMCRSAGAAASASFRMGPTPAR